jgi:hypothetical protein
MGMGSHFQRNAPVRASKARTTPDGISTRVLSSMEEPTTTRPSITGRWRGHVIPASTKLSDVPIFISRNGSQIYLPVTSKVLARSSAALVQRDQPCVQRGLVDASPAWLSILFLGIEPGGYSTIDEPVAIVQRLIDLWVVGPTLSPSNRVQRDHAVERRGQVQNAMHKDRRGLKAAALAPILPL